MEWQNKNIKTVPLTVSIQLFSNDAGSRRVRIVYHYGSNFLYEHEKFNYETMLKIASQNEKLFNWEYKDGEKLKTSDEIKIEKEKGRKL